MGINARFREKAGRQAQIELAVKGILTKEGVMPGLNHFYMDFGKKIYQIKEKHRGQTACTEADIAVQKWEGRGLEFNILEEIKNLYLPCPAAPAWAPFLLDVSELDGEDRLS